MRLPRKVYYNMDTDRLTASNVSTTALVTAPNLFEDNDYIIQVELTSDGAGYDASSISTWSAYYGNLNDPLVTQSNSASFNQVSDWSEANVAAGKISVQLDMTSNVAADLVSDGNVASKTHYLQVVGNDGSNTTTVMLGRFTTNNVVFV